VLTTMRQWGDQYAAPHGPPLELIHRDCGSWTTAVLVCDGCGERLEPRGVEAVAGTGRKPLPHARSKS
jgi:hypothetical protein